MFRNSIVAFLLAGASLMTTGTALAQDLTLRKEFEARYQTMKAAMAAKDADAFAKLLAPDFQSIDISGRTETAAQMAAEVKQIKPDPNKTSITTLISITQSGDTAVVQQKYDMKTMRAGRNVEMVTLSTDTWTKVGGVWLIQKTVTDEMSMLTDGKLVAHMVKS